MEKEENLEKKSEKLDTKNDDKIVSENNIENLENQAEPDDKKIELDPLEKINELEDKLARTFAEMENQRRRFEKEKEEAYEYGGFAFAKEALNLIDNLERSKYKFR